MNKNQTSRRNFIGISASSLAGMSGFPPKNSSTKMQVEANSKPNNKLQIVCVGAHPGDPEFGCGGTMAKYSQAGHTVTLLYLTKGEASEPKIKFEEMAKIRTNEAISSAKILKANHLFAGQIDGNTLLNNAKTDEMFKLLNRIKPDVLFTHWPLDSHPDHQIASLLTFNVWLKLGRKPDLYFYEVDTGGQTMAFIPTDYVDIASVHDLKKEAMFAHKTQAPLETYETYFKPMEQFRGLEAGVKVAEAFIHFRSSSKKATLEGLSL